jgi:hypothetical protein
LGVEVSNAVMNEQAIGKEQILEKLKTFCLGTDGIGGWLGDSTDDRVFTRLAQIDREPLTKVQLNQLLAFGHEAPVSDDFYTYYWLWAADYHPYRVTDLPGFHHSFVNSTAITSLEHLAWGLYRLYTDGLLYFGNVRTAFRKLRALSAQELENFFRSKRFDTANIKARGPALPLETIPKDDRYLISEMACKSYDEDSHRVSALKEALVSAIRVHISRGGGPIAIRRLLDPGFLGEKYASRQQELLFSAEDVLDEAVESEADIEKRYDRLASRFNSARQLALNNTELYLSMVNDLDVYVATSMRTRQDFRDMAADCERIFSDERLRALNLRYFDPTLSAAAGHEDKGLIECLMVKCAKVLVYCAGDRESYGKDAEAAMALSLGKPVIFYCNQERRGRFYREVHPLSRLIEFNTGVAVGAMVTDSIPEVSELLYRIFENKMHYRLNQSKPGNLRLLEQITDSVVRLQTGDRMLNETFWNHYHNRDAARNLG